MKNFFSLLVPTENTAGKVRLSPGFLIIYIPVLCKTPVAASPQTSRETHIALTIQPLDTSLEFVESGVLTAFTSKRFRRPVPVLAVRSTTFLIEFIIGPILLLVNLLANVTS